MDESVYYRTAIPEPWTILGLRLRPFSLGHVLLLHRFESPFVGDVAKATSGDLLFAVFTCSRTYEDAVRDLDDPQLFTWIENWSRQLCRPKVRQRLGLAGPTQIDWPAKFKSFIQYISDGSRYPSFSFRVDQQPQEMGLPLVQIVKCVLLTKTGLSESEIMNRPYGLALTDYITLRAMEGAVQIVDDDSIADAKAQAEAIYHKLNPEAFNGA